MPSCSNPASWHPTMHTENKHHHPPKSWTTDNGTSSKIIPLCGLCHDETHTLLNAYVRAKGVPSWDIRKTYSLFVRKLAQECWDNRIPEKTPYTKAAP